jgi:hypothetical protein
VTVFWSSLNGVQSLVARRFDAAGDPVGADFTVAGPGTAASGGGGILALDTAAS